MARELTCSDRQVQDDARLKLSPPARDGIAEPITADAETAATTTRFELEERTVAEILEVETDIDAIAIMQELDLPSGMIIDLLKAGIASELIITLQEAEMEDELIVTLLKEGLEDETIAKLSEDGTRAEALDVLQELGMEDRTIIKLLTNSTVAESVAKMQESGMVDGAVIKVLKMGMEVESIATLQSVRATIKATSKKPYMKAKASFWRPPSPRYPATPNTRFEEWADDEDPSKPIPEWILEHRQHEPYLPREIRPSAQSQAGYMPHISSSSSDAPPSDIFVEPPVLPDCLVKSRGFEEPVDSCIWPEMVKTTSEDHEPWDEEAAVRDWTEHNFGKQLQQNRKREDEGVQLPETATGEADGKSTSQVSHDTAGVVASTRSSLKRKGSASEPDDLPTTFSTESNGHSRKKARTRSAPASLGASRAPSRALEFYARGLPDDDRVEMEQAAEPQRKVAAGGTAESGSVAVHLPQVLRQAHTRSYNGDGAETQEIGASVEEKHRTPVRLDLWRSHRTQAVETSSYEGCSQTLISSGQESITAVTASKRQTSAEQVEAQGGDASASPSNFSTSTASEQGSTNTDLASEAPTASAPTVLDEISTHGKESRSGEKGE